MKIIEQKKAQVSNDKDAFIALEEIGLPLILSIEDDYSYSHSSRKKLKYVKTVYTELHFKEALKYIGHKHAGAVLQIAEANVILDMTTEQINWSLYGGGVLTISTAIAYATGSGAAFLGILGLGALVAALIRVCN